MDRDRTRQSICRRAAITAVLLALIMELTVSGPVQYMSVYAEEGTEASTEQTAEAAGTSEEGEQSLPVETVKCKSGTPVLPIGDPEAEPPKIKAKGAAMYSIDLDRFVYTKNENQRIDPYSTTKLLTCWLALTQTDPSQTVTVSEKATRVYENGTTIWLKSGEKMTIRDLIYGALLESGNDAAYALGEAVAGSEKSFAKLMNKTVKEWGCKDTNFVNANGWKNSKHYTTAHDLAIITEKCLENEELRKMSLTKEYTIPETNKSGERDLKNYFLKITESPKGLTGGKTGSWDEDDCSVVLSFKRHGLEAVIVLLGDTKKGRPEDAVKLMEFAPAVTPGFEVPAAGSIVETAWIKHGERTRATLTVDKVTYAYPANNKAKSIRTEASYDKLEAPLKKGDEVGEFLVYSGDKLIGKHKLIMAEDVETGWLPSYIYISNRVTKIILSIVLGLVLLILLLRFIFKRINRRKRAARRRQREQREQYQSKH